MRYSQEILVWAGGEVRVLTRVEERFRQREANTIATGTGKVEIIY